MTIVLVLWLAVYVLWMLAMFSMGDIKHWWTYTLSYLAFPVFLAVGVIVVVVMLIITPIGVIFSKEVRNTIISQKEKKL